MIATHTLVGTFGRIAIVMMFLLSAAMVNAQATTTDDVTAPNTGAGGDKALNMFILGGSGLAMVLGALYILSHRTTRSS